MFYSAKFFLEKKNEQQAAVVTSKKAVAVVVISLRYGSGRRQSVRVSGDEKGDWRKEREKKCEENDCWNREEARRPR